MDRTDDAGPVLWKAALAGLAAGLAASLAMNGFQKAVAKLSPSDEQDEPATEKAADRIAQAMVAAPVPDARKPLAGQAVHYTTGAALGVIYGLVTEVAPQASAGGGVAFGLVPAIILDEAVVPAAGLGDPPWKTPAATHAYSLSSHLVFGTVGELTRKLVRRLLD